MASKKGKSKSSLSHAVVTAMSPFSLVRDEFEHPIESEKLHKGVYNVMLDGVKHTVQVERQVGETHSWAWTITPDAGEPSTGKFSSEYGNVLEAKEAGREAWRRHQDGLKAPAPVATPSDTSE